MYSISKKYGVESQIIKDLNKMKNNSLKPGQLIKLSR
ncbi:MAG: LysM peptidoglycan-binding domain-containing protein [Sphingobacteriaceae bacterium]|nr:LysM peptidoglycan-binding domain-containing protein [Sphingobacteriaceae bacterium]